MNLSRHFCGYLCIASLLIANCTGWVHVACVESAGCCSPSVGWESPADAATPGACCQHAHSHSGEDHAGGSTIPGSSTVPGNAPRNHDCPAEHDSDGCSICQSFFASRDAVCVVPMAISDADEPTPFVALLPDRVMVRDPLWGSFSVRGPPQF